MGKCVVKECDSRSQKHNKTSGITFHRVPKDAERCEKWVEIIRLLRKETDWLPTKSTIICSKHFRDQDKLVRESDCSRVYLSNEAKPVLEDDTYSEKPAGFSVEENIDVSIIETDDEIEQLTESPQMHKMRKVIYHLRILSARRLRKIKSMSQKIKRLEIKNKNLKVVIKELKKSNFEQRKDCN